jgi:hypothetical protein
VHLALGEAGFSSSAATAASREGSEIVTTVSLHFPAYVGS